MYTYLTLNEKTLWFQILEISNTDFFIKSIFSYYLTFFKKVDNKFGGDKGSRTLDLLLARQAL